MSLSEIFLIVTTILSVSMISYVNGILGSAPYPDILPSKYYSLPISSSMITFISFIYLFIYVTFKLDDKFLIGFAILGLIPNILNYFYIPLIHPNKKDEVVNMFLDHFHDYESVSIWSRNLALCYNTTRDPSCGLVPGNQMCCDMFIDMSTSTRFKEPLYKRTKLYGRLRMIAYCINVVLFTAHFVYVKCIKE